MTNKKTFLAVIPARGGSKRLPRKNILELAGKPLIAWSIEAAKKSKYINEVLVTSDDKEILEISRHYGANVIIRPAELSSDTATSFDAIKHAIENSDNYDYIILLQPTSPLRTAQHIDDAILLLSQKTADAIISVGDVGHSPLWMNLLPEGDSMENFINKVNSTKRSQDLDAYYQLNGAIYICCVDKLLDQKTFFIKENIFAYKMDQKSSVDIDEELDFKWAGFLLNEK
jgi:CMP-N,N'-diacetyllegionaminic acid synthase